MWGRKCNEYQAAPRVLIESWRKGQARGKRLERRVWKKERVAAAPDLCSHPCMSFLTSHQQPCIGLMNVVPVDFIDIHAHRSPGVIKSPENI